MHVWMLPSNRFARTGRCALGPMLAVLIVLTLAASASGQAAWEYAPYQVNCVVAFGVSPRLPADWQFSVAKLVEERAETVFGPLWDTRADIAESPLRDELFLQLPELTVERAAELAAPYLSGDKLYFVGIDEQAGEFRILVREFDCRARYLGPLITRSVGQRDAVSLGLWDAIVEAFTPAAKIETVDGPRVTARLRAGGLVPNAAVLEKAKAGASLRLIVRRNDRKGEPIKGGVQVLPWTLLEIAERKGSLLNGKLVSGYRNVLSAKSGRRTERFGLLVAPRYEATRLVIQSRAKIPQPLAGYEVFVKGDGEEETRRLGATDWDGALELLRTDGSMQVLLVRSGTQLVARLPLVPGQDPELTATVVDDDRRLQAEGFVQSFQSRVMDLVARREILAARFRQRLKEGKLQEAKEVLEEYRALETRADLNRALDGQLQEVVSPDRTTQQRIDKLFAAARQLLVKFLDPEQANTLTRELAAAGTKSVANAPARP